MCILPQTGWLRIGTSRVAVSPKFMHAFEYIKNMHYGYQFCFSMMKHKLTLMKMVLKLFCPKNILKL